jgi:glucose-1-phosphate thymidylyltransferase
VEKPTEHISDLAMSGVYIFTPTIFEAASSIRPSGRGELEITDAIQYLVDHGHSVRAERISDWWKDTGKLEDLLEANRFVLNDQPRCIEGDVDEASHVVGDVHIARGAIVRDSVIRGPSAVAEGCRIEHSIIDPWTSINANTEIVDSEIGNSIVMGDCHISDARRIQGSLLGRNVRISRAAASSRVQLMVGDNCAITLP